MSRYTGNIITKSPATPTGPLTTGRAPGMWTLSEAAYWTKQGLWPNANLVPDQYFPYTTLLLSTTSLGNANNNLFVDSSGVFNPVSRGGSVATLQGSFTPYGSDWANYFGAAGTSRIETPSNSTLAVCNGTNFTVEGWFYWTNTSNTYPNLIQFWTDSSNRWELYANGSNKKLSIYVGISGVEPPYAFYDTNITVPQLQWFHVAVVKQGAITKIYMNGVLGYTSEITYPTGNQKVVVGSGAQQTDSYNFSGYASNVRVTNTAVYTTNFTVPTAPLTAISGTVLLTCQSNRFRDASSNNYTITSVNSTNLVTNFGPFSPAYPGAVYNQSDITNWSGYFDGSGDYLSASPTALSTGDFTFECWIYPTSTGQYQYFYDTRASVNDAAGFCVIYNHASYPNQISIYSNGFIGTPTITVSTNVWTHFALVRSGGSWRTFVNGVADISPTSVSRTLSNTALKIGTGQALDYFFTGNISNYRIVNGTAVYTGNFTPPTTNLTAISGTSLLTLQNAAFTDNSTNNFVITPTGNVTVTGNSPVNTVGYWSNYFDGSGDYLTLPSNAALEISSGDFTIEAWVYKASNGNYQSIYSNWNDSNSGGVLFCMNGLTPSFLWRPFNISTAMATGPVVTANTWTHVAVVRSGNVFTVYTNGVAGTPVTYSTNATAAQPYQVGAYAAGASGNFNGYMSNVRVVKGTAVYTSNFTPPTSPLTAITNTSLLTCQNGRFIDNSTNAFTITPNGNVSVQSFDPFYTSTVASGGGSMYFSSTNTGALETILNVPASNNIDIGAGDFTVECWVYLTATQNYSRIIQFNNTWASAGATPLINANTDTQKLTVSSYDFNAALITADNTYVFNTWYHVAVTRSGNVFSMYINGVKQSGTYTTSSRLWATTTPFMSIGNGPTSVGGFSPMQGYVADVRIIKGSAIYTANFTPPTTPLTPTPNTVLLVNGMNAGIYDATTINDMTTVGNAQVTTAVSKFGGSSVYFDGSGDYLAAASSPNLSLASANFTLEMWMYHGTGAYVTSQPLLTQNWSTTWGTNFWSLHADHSSSTAGKFTFWVYNFNTGSSPMLISTSTSKTSTWNHIAIVRNGNSFTMYVNGVSEATATFSGSMDGGGSWPIYIGGPNQAYDGYIDDFRLTKGVARYTSNFTPPTAPFPTY